MQSDTFSIKIIICSSFFLSFLVIRKGSQSYLYKRIKLYTVSLFNKIMKMFSFSLCRSFHYFLISHRQKNMFFVFRDENEGTKRIISLTPSIIPPLLLLHVWRSEKEIKSDLSNVDDVFCRRQRRIADQGSISPTFYEQFLRAQIPKAQRQSSKAAFCAFGICARKSCT